MEPSGGQKNDKGTVSVDGMFRSDIANIMQSWKEELQVAVNTILDQRCIRSIPIQGHPGSRSNRLAGDLPHLA
jgi:hypothetical protein